MRADLLFAVCGCCSVTGKDFADWQIKTVPQKKSCLALSNKQSNWPRGKLLGGSSAINYMAYVRGNKGDYDLWAKMGCEGWSYEEVLPYFVKSEDNANPQLVDGKYHGKGGPLGYARSGCSLFM